MSTKKRVLNCKFSGAGTTKGGSSKETPGCGIGITIDKSRITPDQLEELVTGARLVATLIADPQAKDDVDGQKTMMDTHSDHIEGLVSECNGFGSRPDHFSFRLSFHGDVVELTEIGKFAYKEGKVELKRTGNAEPAGEGDHGGDPQD